MTVPKKRKKLDEENVTQASYYEEEKINFAFEVMDKIESSENTKAIEVQKIYPPLVEQGIHIRFKLDLVSLDDFVNMGEKTNKQENSIIFDFTIPYFWNLPIINEVTKTIVTELKKMRIIK